MKQNLQLSDPPLKLKNIALLGYINLISCFCLATGQSQRVITLLRKLQCVYCLHSVASPSRQVYTLASERTAPSTCSCLLHTKYYRHYGCRNRTNLAKESFSLKLSQQVKVIWKPYSKVHPSVLERQHKCTHKAWQSSPRASSQGFIF